ncbi:ankyrin protein [Fusarium tjaetaba]|uniref:Ankyrin protein n=1 Tax=Fusarium tjaetaba TaxID=1567544 RepID=A0A8H5VM20_9HYPO|nr:ankyrin protein [Fusarium tjaetaba]KAF5625834.1 ankyrin protein [Fusarium tjaetaba]
MPQAPRISPTVWEAHRPRITELYVNQDKTLDEVIQIMAESGFHATQVHNAMNVNWKLQKNYTKEQWQYARLLVEKRQAEGKLTKLSIDGKVISEKRQKKEARRYHVSPAEEELAATITSGVVACTPPSLNSRVVLLDGLPWLKFRESFNKPIKSQPPLFVPHQRNESLGFWELANKLLSGVSKHSSMEAQRLLQLVPMLDDSIKTPQKQEPAWLKIFNSLVFLCSNNLMEPRSSANELLQVAISSGFLIRMKHLLTTRGPTVEIFAVHLLFAALGVKGSKGRDFMRFLLESGVSPNSVDPNDRRYSALHKAVRLDDREAVQLLLHFGADPDATTQDSNRETLGSPLSYAASIYYDGTIAGMLIDAGADLNYGSGKPLLQAARKSHSRLVKRLLEGGANPRLLPADGLSMIYFAIRQHDLNLVNMLIEAGASSSLCIDQLEDTDVAFLRNELLFLIGKILTPIQFAVCEGAADIVKRLINNGAILDEYIEPEMLKRMGQSRHSGSLSPLQLSVQRSTDDITKILLDAGAGIDFRHPAKATALQMACELRNSDFRNPTKVAALQMACGLRNRFKNTELIEYLLNRGADIDAPPGKVGGRTPIQIATECEDYQLLKLLLRKGAGPFASTSETDGIALFRAALKSGSVQFVDYVLSELVSQRGNVNCVDGTNYLAEAMSTGNLELLDTVMMSWKCLGLQWPREFILSAVKVAICKGLTDDIKVLDPALSCIKQEDICSMICECIWSGDQKTFDLLIQRSVKSKLDCAQPGYPTPLWLALHQGNHYMAQRLVNAGANPNQQSPAICRRGCCCHTRLEIPLKRAIYQSDGRFIEMLADKGADIHSLIDGSQAPLLVSLERSNESAALYFLSKGAYPNAADPLSGRTALGLALKQVASLSTVQSLINYGADVNKPSMWGTPLVQVARGHIRQHDAIEKCQLLLKADADVNASTGETALQLAVANNDVELAMLLIKAGADINASGLGVTAIEVAVANKNKKLAQLLVEAGANLNIFSVGTTVLQLTISDKNAELAKFFIEQGMMNVNGSAIGQIALQRAADIGDLELVKYLLDRGANTNPKSSGQTALQYAAMRGKIEIVKCLVEHGASVNEEASPYYNATALGLAVANNRTQAAVFLVENGACVDTNPAHHEGFTCLQLAARFDNHQIVTCLVENGATVNAAPATKRGATALQFAAINGNIDMAVFLLENGARVCANRAEIDGRTALEGAAEHGRLDMVHLLLDNDEEPDTIEERCRHAAEFAEAEHHDVIARVLRNYKRP